MKDYEEFTIEEAEELGICEETALTKDDVKEIERFEELIYGKDSRK